MNEKIISKNAHLSDSADAEPIFGNYDCSKFLTDGFELDEELWAKFLPVARKLNLSQESMDLLLEIALELSKKQRAIVEKDEEERQRETIAKYDKMFRDDPDMPDLNTPVAGSYMRTANRAYREFADSALKEIFEKTGLNYYPGLIKMFHKIGKLMEEDGINYGGKPKYEEMTPAQILYGKRD